MLVLARSIELENGVNEACDSLGALSKTHPFSLLTLPVGETWLHYATTPDRRSRGRGMIYRRNLALPLGHDLYECGEAEAVTAHQSLYPLPLYPSWNSCICIYTSAQISDSKMGGGELETKRINTAGVTRGNEGNLLDKHPSSMNE